MLRWPPTGEVIRLNDSPDRRSPAPGHSDENRPSEISEAAIARRLRAAGCVFAEDEARLLVGSGATPGDLAVLVERRVDGEPLEAILGWAEFCGLRIAVAPGVFVPRRRTELLARQAARLSRPGSVVVDLCCGSGAVGTAVAVAVPGVRLYAADIEPAAVACARVNVEPAGGRVFQGDLYAALPDALLGRIDILAVNAPYVPTEHIASMPPEARLHEPRVSLDGGDDGLDVQRRVVAGAGRWLAGSGHVLIETSRRQAPQTAALLEGAGLLTRVVRGDDVGGTVVIGSRG